MKTRTNRRTVYALFTEPAMAERAVDALRSAGVEEHGIVVMSSEPLEEYEFSHRESATWMPWIAAGGGAIGLAAAVLLLVITQNAWPIVTSGMPIVAWWPNLIIMFELTMLGVIVATVATFVVTALLPGRNRPRFYDPAIADGYIVVGVESATDDARIAALLSENSGTVRTA